MNRKLLSLLVVALLLVAAGCGKYADEGNQGGKTAGNNSSSDSSNSGGSNAGNSSNSGSSNSSDSNTNNSDSSNNSSGGSNTAQNNSQQTAEKVNLGPLKAGEAAKLGPLTVTLNQVNVVDKAAGLPPGYIHLMTEVTVVNDGSAVYTANITDHFKTETPEGKKAPYNVQATANRSPRLQGTLKTGENVTGWIGYLAKRVNGNYKFMFIHPDYGQATWEFPL